MNQNLPDIRVCHIYISLGHNFVGHHGRAPGDHPCVEVEDIECVAGRGLRGDRYFDHKPDYKGQITFFAWEVFDRIRRELNLPKAEASAPRRNVITLGVDLNALIDVEFAIQGVRFAGVEECRPCYWMDQALAPRAETLLQGNGGLRARILTDGTLRREVFRKS